MDAPGHIQTKDDDTWIQCPCCKSLLNINSRSELRMIVFDVTQMLWIIPRPGNPCSMWLVCRLDPYGAPVMCFTHSECTFSHMLLVSILSLLSFQQIHGFNRGLFNIQVENCLQPYAISVLVTQDGRALMKEEMPIHCMVKVQSISSSLNTVYAI